MSYRKNRDSYTTSSRQEAARAVLPYLGGFILGLIIWMVWLFSIYMNSVDDIDTNYVMILMLIIILIVEIPIIVLKSYLAYKNRVIKMRPKSSYDIGNIDEYLEVVENYRSGNYEYETIKSEESIIDSHERGKMIVFTAIPLGEKVLIWLGIGLAIFLIVLVGIIAVINSNDLFLTMLSLIIVSSVAIIVGGSISIPNIVKLVRLKRSFFILAPRGIVYMRKWGGIRAYSWKELDLKMYAVQSSMKSFGITTLVSESSQFNIVLPNEAILKFKPDEYSHNEYISFEKLSERIGAEQNIPKSYKFLLFSNLKKAINILIGLSFKYYYDFGKLNSQEEVQDAYASLRIKIELRKSQEEEKHKPMMEKKIILEGAKIYKFFKENPDKAFTLQSLLNRVDELDIDEELKAKVTPDMLEETLKELEENRSISSTYKESQKYYHI